MALSTVVRQILKTGDVSGWEFSRCLGGERVLDLPSRRRWHEYDSVWGVSASNDVESADAVEGVISADIAIMCVRELDGVVRTTDKIIVAAQNRTRAVDDTTADL